VPFQAPGARAARPALIVDALFGTGLSRPVEGAPAAAIRRINAARDESRIVSIDLPSGLDADTGQVLGEAVRAHRTVTLGLPKLGLALEPGRSLAGEVRVARIGLVDAAPERTPDAELWTRAAAGARLPERPRAGHKGRFGHVLVVAGSVGKTGAAALAAEGALRVGAGLATIACPQSLNEILEVKCTEAMTAPVCETPERALALEAEGALLALSAERDVVVLGPGIGRAEDTGKLVRALVEAIERPLVLDADGLFALAGAPEWLLRRRGPTVLTPHPGEAARLTGTSTDEVNRDRVGFASALAERTGAVVLLKGAASVVAGGGGRPLVNPSGGPALASGGSGDVLAGMVGGFLAQGLPAREAAALAAFLHGHAADRFAARCGEAGLLAAELAAELPAAAEGLRAAARAGRDAGLGGRLALAFPEP
jgi:NAD(P)H-hydrate epimerase